MPDRAAEKKALAEFIQVTQTDKNTAAKYLKQHNYNAQAAANAFFQNSSNGPSPIRQTMTKTFDQLRDDPKNEPDEINVEGTGALLAEMGIPLDDIGAFVFFDLVSSPSLGKVTREGFLDGCVEVSADSLPKLRSAILQRRAQLGSSREIFKNVYNHAFVLGLQGNQKSLVPDVALEFWPLLFGPTGFEWRTKRTPWLEWWLEFQSTKWKKAVNRDLWRQTLNFAVETMRDESLGFWNEDSSWPSVVDEFVEWVKVEKRGDAGGGGGSGEAMEE